MSEDRYVSMYDEDGYGNTDAHLKDFIFGSEDYATDTEFAEVEEANRPLIAESPIATRVGEGSIDLWGRSDELFWIFIKFFGGPEEYDSEGDVNDYIFIPSRDDIGSFTLAIGREKTEFAFTGQVMNDLEISSEVGENLAINFGSVGKGGDKEDKFSGSSLISSAGDLSYSDIPVFTMTELTVEIGETEAGNLQTCNLSATNDLDSDYHVLGEKEFDQLLLGQRREITIDLDFKDEDDAIYDDYINGETADIRMIFESATEIAGGVNHQLEVHIPKLQYREYDGTVDGRDPVRTSTSGRALAGTVEFTGRDEGADFTKEDVEIGVRLVTTETHQ